MTDKYTRFRESMLAAGYVPVPRGYVTPKDAETIRSMLIKKTDGNSKILKKVVAHNQNSVNIHT